MTTTSSERRLHPLSIMFELGSSLPRIVFPIVLLYATASWRNSSVSPYIVLAAITIPVIVAAIVGYFRFTYEYGPAELIIRSGLFMRNERRIPYVRIQNLDAAQSLLQRILGVTVVHVQTGGGVEPEATLRVLPVDALHEMRTHVLTASGRAPTAADASLLAEQQPDYASFAATAESAPAAQPRTLLALEPRDLILAGFIENRGMVLILGAFALLEQTGASRVVAERLFDAEGSTFTALTDRWLGGTGVPIVRGVFYAFAALLAIVLFVRVLSTVWAVVRLYDFRLTRVGDDLHTEYGLFTRVNATIPLRRVQTVIIQDRLLHRLTGRRSVAIETAGGGAIEGRARLREPIAPIIRIEDLRALLSELQPGLEPDNADWQPVHPRAFGRILRGSLFWPLLLSAAAWFMVQTWAVAVFALLLAWAGLYAHLRARHLAWAVTPDSIIARDGALTRQTRIARYNRIQVVAVRRNPFDVRTGMAHLRADTAGARGGLVVHFLPVERATALHSELTARTAATAFTW